MGLGWVVGIFAFAWPLSRGGCLLNSGCLLGRGVGWGLFACIA